ncbi:MAG TPA: nucleotidyltransferase family protein [Bacteroidia bacterium]|jgi:predicted nucleotidyltransferase|nr:nucleotidyltransferase family protein [Bacteroidia bacterium]
MKEGRKIVSILVDGLPILRKKYPIATMGIFGSVLRPDFNPASSDIDIVVEFNGDIGWEFIDLAMELEKMLGRRVDLVSRGGIKPRYWEHIKTGIHYV